MNYLLLSKAKMFAKFLSSELIYNWLEANGLQDVVSMHVSESLFKLLSQCAAKITLC